MGQRTWGRINARPSEYLIHLRRGRVVRHGPGLSIFAWPGDSWSIVPTAIQRVTFAADQVTSEKVGVEVRGIAVFRIADPLLAFRVLDFDEHAPMDRVTEILRDMFVGAARRLVANMTVQGCMTRRKEEIAVELMREIAPVVSGSGRPDDHTDRGWGLVVDTIEIQDVRILSESVFESLQAPYRASIEMHARQSQVERDQAVHLREVEASRSKLDADQALQKRRSEVEEASRLSAIERDQRVRRAELESGRLVEAEQHALALEREEQRAAVEHARVEAEREVLEEQLDIARKRGELEADLQRMAREVENLVSEERIRHDYVREVLPALTRALVESAGTVNVTQVQTGDELAGPLAAIMAQLRALASSTRTPEISEGGA